MIPLLVGASRGQTWCWRLIFLSCLLFQSFFPSSVPPHAPCRWIAVWCNWLTTPARVYSGWPWNQTRLKWCFKVRASPWTPLHFGSLSTSPLQILTHMPGRDKAPGRSNEAGRKRSGTTLEILKDSISSVPVGHLEARNWSRGLRSGELPFLVFGLSVYLSFNGQSAICVLSHAFPPYPLYIFFFSLYDSMCQWSINISINE